MTDSEAITTMMAEYNRRSVATHHALFEARQSLADCPVWWLRDRHRLKRTIRNLEQRLVTHKSDAMRELNGEIT